MDTLRFLANFYPRSPCGERLGKSGSTVSDTLFLSTLSLRRATAVIWFIQLRQSNFYPRSPCGERLSTNNHVRIREDFYPRSPCGERLPTLHNILKLFAISIHALLAESDQAANGLADTPPEISIHALLAESDGDWERAWTGVKISIHALLAESDPAGCLH